MRKFFNASQILAHRGLWSNSGLDQNSIQALTLASSQGFGIETDLRVDSSGVWIAHDLEDLEKRVNPHILFENGTQCALNIKSDGLLDFALKNIDQVISSKSFFFDGSIPQMYLFKKSLVPHALRISEYENEIPWKSEYLWLDSFENDWWVSRDLEKLTSESTVVVVSPELHGREYVTVWSFLHNLPEHIISKILVCTDYPSLFLNWNSHE